MLMNNPADAVTSPRKIPVPAEKRQQAAARPWGANQLPALAQAAATTLERRT